MPEGDTIHRAAAALHRALSGQTIRNVQGQSSLLGIQRLIDAKIAKVEARGKHLLIHNDAQLVLHTHMGMTGSWHIYTTEQPWQKPRSRAALILHCDTAIAVCYSPKTCELLTVDQLRRHPYLGKLGPDLLQPTFDLDTALGRFREHGALPVGEAIMNQTIVSGIGNVYKSELLFLQRLSPFMSAASLSLDEIRELLAAAVRLMRRNLTGGLRATRFGRDGQRLWVYNRAGEPCLVCGTRIQMRRQGGLGRSTYWCPTCQPEQR